MRNVSVKTGLVARTVTKSVKLDVAEAGNEPVAVIIGERLEHRAIEARRGHDRRDASVRSTSPARGSAQVCRSAPAHNP